MHDIVYFELNHWSPGDDYPDCEPYLTWMDEDVFQFRNKEWLEKNKIVVVETLVDMSCNYCITATKEWVEKNCNEILTTNTKFYDIRIKTEKYTGNLVVHSLNIQKRILVIGLQVGMILIIGNQKESMTNKNK